VETRVHGTIMVAFDFWNLEGKAPPVPFDAGPIGPARALRFGHERENGSSIRMAPGGASPELATHFERPGERAPWCVNLNVHAPSTLERTVHGIFRTDTRLFYRWNGNANEKIFGWMKTVGGFRRTGSSDCS